MRVSLLQPARRVNGVYQNPVPTTVAPLRHLPTMIGRALRTRDRAPLQTLGPFRTDVSVYREPPVSGVRITLLGHSSVLLEVDGVTLLTDPVFSKRASFSQSFGPKRFYPAPISIADLPPIDVVLLSHNHYDHLDRHAVPQLVRSGPNGGAPVFVASEGVGRHLRQWGVAATVRELNWMSSTVVETAGGATLKLTALPARHFSGRGLRRNRTLWSSFLLESARHRIYHGADSGFYPGFAEIGERLGPFDLALLEIGAFDSLWADIHLGPDNALRAAHDLRTDVLMPIHWGLFNLAFHSWWQPGERITEIAAGGAMPLFLPEPGIPTEFTGEAYNSLWWRRFLARAG